MSTISSRGINCPPRSFIKKELIELKSYLTGSFRINISISSSPRKNLFRVTPSNAALIFEATYCVSKPKDFPFSFRIKFISLLPLGKLSLISVTPLYVLSSDFKNSAALFNSAKDFIKHYENCSKNIKNKEIYLSYVVKSMINDNHLFLFTKGSNYEDYGTFTDWLRIRKKYRTFFVDLDGVVFRNKGKYGLKNWGTKNEPIKKNIETLLKLNLKGTQIVFVSARHQEYYKNIDKNLKKLGFKNYKILLGLHHSQRILINDYFITNPNPSALSINIPRDNDNLGQLVESL